MPPVVDTVQNLFTDNVPFITGSTELSLNRMVVLTAFGGFKSSKVRSERKYNRLRGSGSGLQYALYPWSAVCICNSPLLPPSAVCSPHSAFYTDRFLFWKIMKEVMEDIWVMNKILKFYTPDQCHPRGKENEIGNTRQTLRHPCCWRWAQRLEDDQTFHTKIKRQEV